MTDRGKWQPKYTRSPIEILADILRLLRLGNTGKIQIAHYARLNQKQTSNYIAGLLEAGLLEGAEQEMGLPSYRITKKGLAALSLIENIKEMLPQEGTKDFLHRSKIVELNVGQIFVTKRVAELATEDKEFAFFIEESLNRYRKGDWGNMSDEGKQLNKRFLESGLRMFSKYESTRFPEIWIIAEPERSCSTIMFSDDDVSTKQLEPYQSSKELKLS
jgi:predicted transcriptional regulator